MDAFERDTSIRLEQIEADIAVLKYLVEVLYVWRFKGQLDFEKFRDGVVPQFEKATSSELDPAQSDHLSQILTERLLEVLDRIGARLKSPKETPNPKQPID